MANDLSAFNSEAWSDRLVTKLDQVNVLLPLVNRDWEGDLRQNKTVWIRTPGNITLGSYTRGTTVTYQDLTPTKEAFTVNDGEYFAFLVDDIDKAQSDTAAMDVYMKRAVVAMDNVVEAKLLSAYASTNVPTGNKIAGAGSAAITLDSSTSASTGIYQIICQIRTIQSNNNVPLQGRWLIVDPATTALLYQDTAHFIRSTDMADVIVQEGLIGGEAVRRTAAEAPGFVGRVLGYDVYETPHVPTSGGAKFLVAGDRDAITYAAQITEIEALRLQTTFADAVRGLVLHDVFVPAECGKRIVTVKATP